MKFALSLKSSICFTCCRGVSDEKIRLYSFFSLCSGAAVADLVNITGTVPAKVSINSSLSKSAVPLSQPISFQYLKLSTPAQIALKGRINELQVYGNLASYYKAAVRLPAKYNLGMGTLNNIVLNQGIHGTCVTFAMTAAISARASWFSTLIIGRSN